MLVRQLVLNTRLPIIAAGGIMDGHAIRAMQELGAAAAQLGTAFVATSSATWSKPMALAPLPALMKKLEESSCFGMALTKTMP